MSCSIYFAKRYFRKYSSDWDRLNSEYFNNHPLLDSRFASALLECFGSDNVMLAVCGRNQIEGMALLVKENFYSWRTFLPGQAPIALSLLKSADTVREISSSLPFSCLMIDFLCQDPNYSYIMPSSSRTVAVLPHAHTLNVHVKGEFSDYWNNRKGKLRENIRRYIRRATSEIGEERLKIITDTEETRDAVERFGGIETRGWKGKLGTAVHKENMQGKFYSEVLKNFSRTKQGFIFELYFGEKLLASQLATTNDDIMVLLKTTYDEDFKRYAPGRILLYRLLEKEFELRKRNFIEFYTNANDDQLNWASDSRYINHLSFFKKPSYKTIHELTKKVRGNN